MKCICAKQCCDIKGLEKLPVRDNCPLIFRSQMPVSDLAGDLAGMKHGKVSVLLCHSKAEITVGLQYITRLQHKILCLGKQIKV